MSFSSINATSLESLDKLGTMLEALAIRVLLPATSLIKSFLLFPTDSGFTCSKLLFIFKTPSMCIPPLCAKADFPIYGLLLSICVFDISAILLEVAYSWEISPLQSYPIFNFRFGIITDKSALPHLSPTPINVPWTCDAPAPTAIILFATAQPVSL